MAASDPVLPPLPLLHKWVLYFEATQCSSQRMSQSRWEKGLRPVATVSSVQEFWAVMNNIVNPADLPKGSNYFLFKEGYQPMWECPALKGGGRYVVQLSPQGKAGVTVRQSWEDLCMAVVGGMFHHDELICGIAFSPRAKAHKVAVWLKQAPENLRTDIAYAWELLRIGA